MTIWPQGQQSAQGMPLDLQSLSLLVPARPRTHPCSRRSRSLKKRYNLSGIS